MRSTPILPTPEGYTACDALWPEHAGHEIRYSEHGRTDYRVSSVLLGDDGTGGRYIDDVVYDNLPVNGDIVETEYWCATCGQQLPQDWA